MKNSYLIILITLFIITFLSKNSNGQTLISKTPVMKQRYYKIIFKESKGDTITCYISMLSASDKDVKRPLLIFIQGSGRHSLFTKDTVLNYGARGLREIAKGKARILVIEKPGVEFLDQDKHTDDSSDNKKFNQKFSLQSWSTQVGRFGDMLHPIPWQN